MLTRSRSLTVALLVLLTAGMTGAQGPVDWPMVAKIRAEGLQRSRVMDLEGYMADVLGARLTLSKDMQRAQLWVRGEMERIGLVNVAAEPFMNFGAAWDNEYVSIHMLEPDYQPMVGYPLAHTPGTDGKQVAQAMIVDLQSKQDLERYRGKLAGMAILATPPAVIDLAAMTNGVRRRTEAELDSLERVVIVPRPAPAPRTVRNPDVLTAVEKMAFYKACLLYTSPSPRD